MKTNPESQGLTGKQVGVPMWPNRHVFGLRDGTHSLHKMIWWSIGRANEKLQRMGHFAVSAGTRTATFPWKTLTRGNQPYPSHSITTVGNSGESQSILAGRIGREESLIINAARPGVPQLLSPCRYRINCSSPCPVTSCG